MKTLIVSPHFPPRYIGGVEMYAKRLADALRARGDVPAAVAVEHIDRTQAAIDVAIDRQFGYPVYRLSGPVVNQGERIGASYNNNSCERAVEQIIDAVAPDVLHLHSGYLLGGAVLAAARRRRIPTIVTLHDYWFLCPRITLTHPNGTPCSGPESAAKCAWCLMTESRRYRLPDAMLQGGLGRGVIAMLDHSALAPVASRVRAVRALSARRSTLFELLDTAELILSPSHFLREQMIRAGFRGGRIQVSRYGIEMPVERVTTETRGSLRIGYLGQIAPHKGVHHLIDALGRIPSGDCEVRIYGDLSREPDYVRRLRASADGDRRITFQGPYVHAQVYEILSHLDVIVVPSVWYENAPFVIQEAQAARVPVVASRLGGMRELVSDDVNGLLFEPADSADLARQLERLIHEPGLVERLRPDPSVVRSLQNEFEELFGHYTRLLGERVGESHSNGG